MADVRSLDLPVVQLQFFEIQFAIDLHHALCGPSTLVGGVCIQIILVHEAWVIHVHTIFGLHTLDAQLESVFIIQFYGFVEHVVSVGIHDGCLVLVVFVYVQAVAGLDGSAIRVRHVVVLIPISLKTCLLGQVVFLLEIFSVEPHEIVCEFGLSVLPVVILIGRDGAHHGLTAVSLYAEFVFLHAVDDPVDQLLFLLERYLCHLGPALSSVDLE